jgi:hypothetical protein
MKWRFFIKNKKLMIEYVSGVKYGYKSLDSSRDVYSSINEANKVLRRLEVLKKKNGWGDEAQRKVTKSVGSKFNESYLGSELIFVVKKIIFGLSVLIGWLLVLGLVIIWFGRFE